MTKLSRIAATGLTALALTLGVTACAGDSGQGGGEDTSQQNQQDENAGGY